MANESMDGKIPTTRKLTAAELAEGKTITLDGNPKVGKIVVKNDEDGNLDLHLLAE